MSNIENKNVLNKTVINWYPGHMAKTKREIKEALPLIDVVLELVDARIPNSTHIKELDSMLKNKKVIIVFNKYDLCDKEETNKWKEYFESIGFIVILCNSKDGVDHKKIINKINELMENVNSKRKSKGLLSKKAKVMVVGVPNVGKSTLINKLVNKKIVDTGNKPGVTKSLRTIRVSELIDLVDTPGILWPKIETEEEALNMASMTVIKEDVIPIDKTAIHILIKLDLYYKDILKNNFNIDYFNMNEIENIFEVISKKLNIPLSSGEIDYEKISFAIINQVKQEKIKGITFDRKA